MSPQHTPQPSFGVGSQHPIFNSALPHGPPLRSWSNASSTAPTPVSAAGRKRSRDEASFNDDDYFPVQAPAAPRESENDVVWEYGEGMTLIKPHGNGYHISAESQTGTWAEEKAEEQAQAVAAMEDDGPILRSAKSQRLDLTSTPAIQEEVSLSNGSLVNPLLSTANGTTAPLEPTIDDFTRYLGIGWSSINPTDQDIQAAVRGWAKYIENHFPIHDVQFRLQSRGLSSYLVEAREGYFLFGEDLKQGQLVSSNLEQTFANLRGPVPIFDGVGVMEAGDSPKPTNISLDGTMIYDDTYAFGTNGIDEAHDASAENFTASTLTQVPAQSLEVEMDMS